MVAEKSLVCLRCGLLHSICRCGELPFVSVVLLVQKGQASSVRWVGGVLLFCVSERMWCSLYLELHRSALVCETAVYNRSGRVILLCGNVVLGLCIMWL